MSEENKLQFAFIAGFLAGMAWMWIINTAEPTGDRL